MTTTHLVASLQRAEVETELIEGARVAPSVIYLTDRMTLGGLTLAAEPKCSFAAIALPMRICPEIELASVAMNGTLQNLNQNSTSATAAYTIMQFHRDGSWAIEISPYLRTNGMLVWDVEPRRFDDAKPPGAMRELVDHLYHHLAENDVYGRGWELDNLKDRFRVAGEILMQMGDVTAVRIEGGKT